MAATPIRVPTIPDYTPPSNAIYAAYNGLSGNAGTSASPTSLAAAISKASATGSTIVLKGVSTVPYRIGDLSLGKSIKFIAEPGASPVLCGAKQINPADVKTESASGTYYIDHTSNIAEITGQAIDPKYPTAGNRQQLFVNNEYFRQVPSKGELTAKTFFYQKPSSTLPTGRIYTKDNITTTGFRIELTDTYSAFKFNTGCEGSSFIGIGFEKYAHSVGQVEKNNITFDSCAVWHNAYFGLQGQLCQNYKILNCLIFYNGSNGFSGGRSGKNWIIKGNEVAYNNYANFNKAYNAAGMKITNSHEDANPVQQDYTISDNKVHHNNSHGLWLDINCNRYRVFRNRCSYNVSGIFFEISGHATHPSYIVDNLCYQNSFGIFLSHSSYAWVFNNTVVLNQANIKVKDDNRQNKVTTQVTNGYTWRTKQNRIVNNIIGETRSNGAENAIYDGTSYLSTATFPVMIVESHHNAYYRKLATDVIFRFNTESHRNKPYTSITDFVAENPGAEQGSIGRSGGTSHPYFSDANFTVRSDSPTRTAGAAINNAVIADILGVAVGTVVPMGAQFYLTATDPVPPPDEPTEPVDPCDAKIQDAVSELMTELSLAKDDLAAADRTILQLEGQIATLQSQVSTLQTQVATLQQEKDALKTQTDATIAQLQQDKAALQSQVTNLEGQVTSLQGQITTLQQEKDALVQDKAALQSSLDAANTNIGTLTSEKQALQDSLNAANARIAELESSSSQASQEAVDLKNALVAFLDLAP